LKFGKFMKLYLFVALVAFALSFAFCYALIPVLRKYKAGQNILVYVKEHSSKKGTPTMGGIAFVAAAVLAIAVFLRTRERVALVTLAIGLSYMIVGLLDDFLKRKHKQNLGLRAWQKFAFQACIALLAGIFCFRAGLTKWYIPLTKRTVNVGWGVIPLSAFVFLATVNAVNLTDGLDGLAAGTSVPFFVVMATLILVEVGNSSMVVVCFALSGALIGYLPFNISPASVFMGDTGSLSLGGFAACVGLFTGNAFYIAIVGVMFVLSVVSVLLQVVYFKCTGGKRIFLMSPIHHHFQEKGYSESRIAYAYFLVTLVVGTVCIAVIL